jgi:argininosuccinate synthase
MPRIVVPVLTASAADAIAEMLASGVGDVIAVAVDVGQPGGLEGLRDAALGAGALRCHAVDVKASLAERLCWPALRAGALRVPGEPIVTALSMPLVAETVADVCRHEAAEGAAVWSESPSDRQRLRALLRDLAPSLGLVSVRAGSAAAAASNLWATVAPVADVSSPEPARAQSGRATLEIGFRHGLADRLNGVALTAAEIIDSLATIAADHGVPAWTVAASADRRAWRVEAPAALVLDRAVAALAGRVLDARTRDVADSLAQVYAGLVRDGAWFTAARDGVDAFMARVFDNATGDVTVHIDNGRIEVAA